MGIPCGNSKVFRVSGYSKVGYYKSWNPWLITLTIVVILTTIAKFSGFSGKKPGISIHHTYQLQVVRSAQLPRYLLGVRCQLSPRPSPFPLRCPMLSLWLTVMLTLPLFPVSLCACVPRYAVGRLSVRRRLRARLRSDLVGTCARALCRARVTQQLCHALLPCPTTRPNTGHSESPGHTGSLVLHSVISAPFLSLSVFDSLIWTLIHSGFSAGSNITSSQPRCALGSNLPLWGKCFPSSQAAEEAETGSCPQHRASVSLGIPYHFHGLQVKPSHRISGQPTVFLSRPESRQVLPYLSKPGHSTPVRR